jgi:hypothetical protein
VQFRTSKPALNSGARDPGFTSSVFKRGRNLWSKIAIGEIDRQISWQHIAQIIGVGTIYGRPRALSSRSFAQEEKTGLCNILPAIAVRLWDIATGRDQAGAVPSDTADADAARKLSTIRSPRPDRKISRHSLALFNPPRQLDHNSYSGG